MINKPNITVNTKKETRNRRKMTRRDSFQHVSEMVYNDKTGQYHLQKTHVVRSPIRSNNGLTTNNSISSEDDDKSILLKSNNNNNNIKSSHNGEHVRLRGNSISSSSDILNSKKMYHLPSLNGDNSCKNTCYMQLYKCNHICKSLFLHIDRSWFFLILLGVSTTLLAWLVDEASVVLHNTHLQSARLVEKYASWWISYFLYVGWSVLGATVAIGLTNMVHSGSNGSGIPQIKSILQGFHQQDFLGWRMLIAKVFGLILARGSTLNIGSEGPFVCIGASLAVMLLDLPISGLKVLRKNAMLRRDLLGAAAAAGVSATFGAPIGGVLFSIEVTSSYFMVSAYWKGFFCAVCGAIVFKQLGVFSHGRDNSVSLFTTSFEPLPYDIFEFFPFIILSIICGILAGIYVRFQANILNYYNKHFPRSRNVSSILPRYMIPGLIVVLLTAMMEYPLGSFMTIGLRHGIDDLFHEGHLDEKLVTHADDWTTGSLTMNLLYFTFFKFVFSACNVFLPLPYGVVIPVFAVGAGLGRLFGEYIAYLGTTETIVAGGYAVVGAASFTAGVTQTISIAVIVFELTSQLSYALPVLIGSLLARGISSLFTPGIFNAISKRLNLPGDPSLGREELFEASVMSKCDINPPYLPRKISPRRLKEALNHKKEEWQWAIVDDTKTMILIGTVSRVDLIDLIENIDQWAVNNDEDEAVDLVSSELLDLDFLNARVRAQDSLSNVLLHFSITSDPIMFVTDRGSLKGVIRSEDLMQTLPLFYDVQREGVNSLMNVMGDKIGTRRSSYTSLNDTSTMEDDDDDERNNFESSVDDVNILEKMEMEKYDNDGDAGAGNKK